MLFLLMYSLLVLPRVFASPEDQIHLSSNNAPDHHAAETRGATSNYLFSSIAGLTQQWSNTRYRNGHTIALGSVPVGTVLYHGQGPGKVPLTPEWVATNAEHAYLFCPDPACHLLTFSVQKALKVLYFDGSSAAKSPRGHLDTQDLLLWGRTRPDKLWNEDERIKMLCDWGFEMGIDGYLRMQPGFEIMLCNFREKVSLVSSSRIIGWPVPGPYRKRPKFSIEAYRWHYWVILRQWYRYHHNSVHEDDGDTTPTGSRLYQHSSVDLHIPLDDFAHPTLPNNTYGPLRPVPSVILDLLQAAAWNNFYPGEARFRVDYTRLVSFYDPRFKGLIDARERAMRRKNVDWGRTWHRLNESSMADVQNAMRELREAIVRPESQPGSGVDWQTLIRSVMDRYSARLETLRDIIAEEPPPWVERRRENATAQAMRARLQVQVMLTPYLLAPAPSAKGKEKDQMDAIRRECARALVQGLPPEASMEKSEVMISCAIKDVLGAICTTLTDIWVDAFDVEKASTERAQVLVKKWWEDTSKLMSWLDWDVWSGCRPACTPDRFCYITTWPLGGDWMDEEVDIDLTPKCVHKIEWNLGPLPGS